MARNWRKSKLLKAAVGGTVVGLTGGATALAAAGAVSPDPTPVDAPSDDVVSLELDEDGTVQVTVDDEILDDLDGDDQGADADVETVSGDTPPAQESVETLDSVDQDSVDADEESVDADDQNEDADDQGEDESVDNDDESADSD